MYGAEENEHCEKRILWDLATLHYEQVLLQVLGEDREEYFCLDVLAMSAFECERGGHVRFMF